MSSIFIYALIIVGLGALAYPALRSVDRKRTQARLTFLTTRLSSNARQLSQTTAKRFPTDYQRLQQQVALDMNDLSKLLRDKGQRLPIDVVASAWDLVDSSALLLPSQPDLARPLVLEKQAPSPQLVDRKLAQVVPEIWPILQNIQADDREIRQKIEEKKLPNRQELLVLHEANMTRYQDILDAYLKIKQSPKDYYQAEERLAKSQHALEQFDLLLDDTLRQINEGDMMNFEISLRMMEQNHNKNT